VIIDHEGKVQKELHNNDPEYIKYKFFYNDDEEREYYLIFLIYFFFDVFEPDIGRYKRART